jgi:hypothetical protein
VLLPGALAGVVEVCGADELPADADEAAGVAGAVWTGGLAFVCFVSFFGVFESLLGGSLGCCAAWGFAMTLVARNRKVRIRTKHAPFLLFFLKISLRPRQLIQLAWHTHRGRVWAEGSWLSEVRRGSSSLEWAHDVEEIE